MKKLRASTRLIRARRDAARAVREQERALKRLAEVAPDGLEEVRRILGDAQMRRFLIAEKAGEITALRAAISHFREGDPRREGMVIQLIHLERDLDQIAAGE